MKLVKNDSSKFEQKNISRTGSVTSKNTGLTARTNFFSECASNKKSYKEFAESKLSINKSVKSLNQSVKEEFIMSMKESSSDLKTNRTVKEFCKKNLVNITNQFRDNLPTNLYTKKYTTHKNNSKSKIFNKTSDSQLFRKQNAANTISTNLNVRSIKNISEICKPQNNKPLMINYSKKNPLKQPLTEQKKIF